MKKNLFLVSLIASIIITTSHESFGLIQSTINNGASQISVINLTRDYITLKVDLSSSGSLAVRNPDLRHPLFILAPPSPLGQPPQKITKACKEGTYCGRSGTKVSFALKNKTDYVDFEFTGSPHSQTFELTEHDGKRVDITISAEFISNEDFIGYELTIRKVNRFHKAL